MSDQGLGVIVPGNGGPFGMSPSGRTYRAIGNIIANVTVEERHQDDLEITDHPIEQGAVISDHAFKRPVEVTIECAWSNSPSTSATLLGGSTGALTIPLASSVQNQLAGAVLPAIGGSSGAGNFAIANLSTLISNPLISFGAQVNSGTGVGTSTVQDVYQQLLALQNSAVPFTVYTGKRKYDSMLIKSMTVRTDKTTENALIAQLVCRQVIIVTTSIVAIPAPASDQASPQDTAGVVEAGTKQLAPVDEASIDLPEGLVIHGNPNGPVDE